MMRIQNNKRRRCRQYIQIKPKLRYLVLNLFYNGWDSYVLPYSPMIRKVTRLMIKVSIAGFVLTVITNFFLGQEIGCLEAKYDLWRSHYELRIFTSNRSHEAAYRKLFNPYGIHYNRVDDYPSSIFVHDSVAAYNRIMKKAIRSDLGLDVDSLFNLFNVLNAIETDMTETSLELVDFYKDVPPAMIIERNGNNDAPRILMEAKKPVSGSMDDYQISDCHSRFSVDVDGDSIIEEICLRELLFKKMDRSFTKKSVVLDLNREEKLILRQELRLGQYYHEIFHKIADIDSDGRIELVTAVNLGPDCAGCSALRVYRIEQGRFERVVSVFNTDLNHPAVVKSLKGFSGMEEKVLNFYQRRTGADLPCGYGSSCMASEPWLADVDGDGRPECLFLSEEPYLNHSEYGRYIHIVVAEISADGQIVIGKVHSTRISCCDGFVNLLGFLKTGNSRFHLLVNVSWGGTSIVYPILHIYDFSEGGIQQIGELGGFYEQVISERLVDLNSNGTTEIIYIEDAYWPPGGAHVDVIPIYGIAAYLGGQYREANRLFENVYQQLNRFIYPSHPENHPDFPDLQ